MSETESVAVGPQWEPGHIVVAPPEEYNLKLRCGAPIRLLRWGAGPSESWLTVVVGGHVKLPLARVKQDAFGILIPQLEAALEELRELEAQKGKTEA